MPAQPSGGGSVRQPDMTDDAPDVEPHRDGLLADEHGPARMLLCELDVDLPALTEDISGDLGQVHTGRQGP